MFYTSYAACHIPSIFRLHLPCIFARQGLSHGGLLDTGGVADHSAFAPAPGTPDGTYWLVNVARAQHARAYSWTGPSPTPPPDVLSPPLPASAIAQGYAPGATVSHNGTACGLVDGASPTFLSKYFGNPWGCYWEYVWQGQAYPYMHRPLDWGVLEFREQAAAAAGAAGATSPTDEASGVLAPAGAAPCFDVV